jgi:Ca-activated chloride channel homolog
MTNTQPMIEFGSSNAGLSIALRGVRLTATLAGGSLEATLEHTFVNLEKVAIEAIYTFPLPETAAVFGFEVRTGDHVLTGRVEESDDALRQYDDAIADGHGAYLLEQDRPDVFTLRAGNLKPKQAATIGISYEAPLERVDRSIRVRFPTTIAPRYVSAAGSTDPLQTAMDADALNPPHALHVPYGVEMRIEVRLGPEVRGLSSPSHRVTVERPSQPSEAWVVGFAGGIAEMDRDIVLEIETARETEPQVQLARGPDDARYLALTFVPEFDELETAEPHSSETVFLVDCSGSMQGESILQAIRALELCLRSLSAGDTFNVCRFGSTFQLLSAKSLAYSAATLEQALEFIRLGADLGGTEIYAPLAKILAQPPSYGIRNVVVLTDGQVSNEPAVIDLARSWRTTNRLFTFGIGTSASGYLVRSLARVTQGAAEFVTGDERIEDKVLRTFSRMGSPQVSNTVICWGDNDLQTPAEIPPVFDGDVLRVFARAPGKLPKTVSLECDTPMGRKSWELTVPQTATEGRVIARSWARAMIQSWEEAEEPQNTSPARRESSAARRLVAISKQFSILCSRTSFIAVEHRTAEERNAGLPELRRLPLKLAHGWGGTRGVTLECLSSADYGAIDAMRSSPASAPAPRRMMRSFGYDAIVYRDCDEPMSAAPDPVDPSEVVFALLACQSAEGWFDEGFRFVLVNAGYDVVAVETEVVEKLGDHLQASEPETRTRITATAAVLLALERWFSDRKATMRRADKKARRWLTQTAGVNAESIERLLARTSDREAP